MLLRVWFAVIIICLTMPLKVSAKEFKLTDGSILNGELISNLRGVCTIRLQVGSLVSIESTKIISGCEETPQLSSSSTLSAASLHFAGSNTIGEKLLPALAEAYLRSKGCNQWQWTPTTVENEKILTIKNPAPQCPSKIDIKAHGSSTAFKALKKGETDIGMSSRPIKPTEVEQLSQYGKMTDANSEYILALDGLAVIIHPNNPLHALTKQQIAHIFACQITDWSQLTSAKSGAITIYARDDNSGTYDTFKNLVLKPYGLSICSNAERLESSEELSDNVTDDPDSIGFIGLGYIRQAKPLALKECDLSYSPTAFAVKTEEYPLARRLFLYKPKTLHNPLIADFIAFALSEAGQQVVEKIGFINLSINAGTDTKLKTQLSHLQSAIIANQNIAVLQDFAEITSGANRLSVTFRFSTGSSTLDNRAFHDVKRLANYLKQPNHKNKQLILLGFADMKGDYSRNLKLSAQRAEAVANLLKQEGVKIALIKGMGEEAPVACNDSASGQAKNRHVEVWLK